jgi:hypothetical protein
METSALGANIVLSQTDCPIKTPLLRADSRVLKWVKKKMDDVDTNIRVFYAF